MEGVSDAGGGVEGVSVSPDGGVTGAVVVGGVLVTGGFVAGGVDVDVPGLSVGVPEDDGVPVLDGVPEVDGVPDGDAVTILPGEDFSAADGVLPVAGRFPSADTSASTRDGDL